MQMQMKDFNDFLTAISAHKERIALQDSVTGKTVSYEELVESAYKVAAWLRGRGVSLGDRIVLYQIQDISWVPLFLGAQAAGAIVVPLDSRLNQEVVGDMIAAARPTLVITDIKTESGVPTVGASEVLNPNGATKEVTRLPKDAIAEVLLTSGTWSNPKGVTLTQSNLLSNLEATNKTYTIDQDEVFLSILPLAHAYQQMCGLLMPLHAGTKIVYIPEITPAVLKNSMKKYQVTMLVAVPRVLELFQKGILREVPKRYHRVFVSLVKICRHLPLGLRRLMFQRIHSRLAPYLHTVVIGGAPYSLELDRFFLGLGFTTLLGYGLSETSPIISVCTRPATRTNGSVGRPLETLSIEFNKDSEILVKGPSVLYGYWPRKRLEEWFNTGDQGYLNQHGDLVLTGRTKNLIIYPTGDKVFLEDIEVAINAIDGVDESCVLYPGNNFLGQLDVALRSEIPVTSDEVQTRLARNFPRSVQIGRVINVYPDYLPRTNTHKLNRSKAWSELGSLNS